MTGFGGGAFAARPPYPVAGHRKYQAGFYYGPGPHTMSTGAPGTGVQTMVPFWVGAPFTADRIGIESTASTANAVARLGIYGVNQYDEPSTMLLDAGTVDASTAIGAGGSFATISYAFLPGLYYLSAASQVASATFRTIVSYLPPVSINANPFGSTPLNCYYKTGIAGAFADVSALSVGGAAIKVLVRAA